MKKYLLLFVIFTYTISFAQWANNQNAEYVIGQPNFTTYASGATMQNFNRSSQCAVDYVNHKLYVVDMVNYRVLRFSYPITSSNPAAEVYFVNGEIDPLFLQYGTPTGVAVYNGTLWICDNSHHRILKFNNAYSASNAPDPDGVLGQSDFSVPAFNSTSQSRLYSPSKICIDNSGNLWVADANNNRVLKFNDANNKANGANADLVLGQDDFNLGGSSTTQSGLFAPSGVFVYGNTVWVADQCNNRVLRYNNPTINGVNADGVLGQMNFTTGALEAVSNSTFNNPIDVSIDNNGRLYVADVNNSRIMIFNDAASKSDGAPADNVLGQLTFNTNAANNGQNGFYYPNSVTVDPINNKLLVSDFLNHRIMQFSASSALPVDLISFNAKIAEGQVLLDWQTATEQNNYGFELERNTPLNPLSRGDNAENPLSRGDERGVWKTLGFVNGAGNSNSPKKYSFVDSNPILGNVQYRLKQIDLDGNYKYYSQLAEVSFSPTDVKEKLLPKEFGLSQNYPNPFNPSTVISYQLPVSGNVTLKVYDMLGKEVATLVNENSAQGEYRVEFNGRNLASGIYYYQLRCGNFIATKKFILMK